MKKILAALFCVSLLGMPIMAQATDGAKSSGCCAQKQTQMAKKECSKENMAKKDCCAQQTAKKADCSSEKMAKKACNGCVETAETWMTAPATCKKGCKTASL